jgi:hypothetical protein
MEPVITEKNSHLQIIITLGLIGLLIAIVGGYIYYGMLQAKQEQMLVETPIAPEQSVQDPVNFSQAERQMILDDLAKEIPVDTEQLSETDRTQILEELKTPLAEKETPLTEAEKRAILESLSAQMQPDNETPSVPE